MTAPELLVLAEAARVRARRRLDRERVPQQRLALRVAGQRLPGPVARHVHGPTTIPRFDMAITLSTGMQAFVIEGGRPLGGTIRAAGNKNGALPILAACRARHRAGPARRTCPASATCRRCSSCSPTSGRRSSGPAENDVAIDPTGVHKTELDEELCRRIRASFLLAGPLLARFGRAVVPPPGGDVIGRRRLDPHIHGLAELGVEIEINGRYEMSAGALAREVRLPRRGERDGDRERRHGRGARRGRDRDRERGLRAARPGSLPLPRLARRADRGDRVERPAHPGRRDALRWRVARGAGAHRGRQLHRPRRGDRERSDDRGRRAARPDLDPARRSSGSASGSRSGRRPCAFRPASGS